LSEIGGWSGRGVARQHGLRSTRLSTFPIKVVFTVRDGSLLVVAVFHTRRGPGYWFSRLARLTH
jgi:hypothetical protein